jgi:hypothetical protein
MTFRNFDKLREQLEQTLANEGKGPKPPKLPSPTPYGTGIALGPSRDPKIGEAGGTLYGPDGKPVLPPMVISPDRPILPTPEIKKDPETGLSYYDLPSIHKLEEDAAKHEFWEQYGLYIAGGAVVLLVVLLK